MKTTLIHHVRIADGSGAPPFAGALRIAGERIAAVAADAAGGLVPAAGETIVDGGGMLLAPGFLDAHGHSDLSALASPPCFGKVAQGITTEISGNCGLSPFPLTACNRAHLEELYRQYGRPLDWEDCAGYRERLRACGVRLKLAPLCGHNTLRAAVAGYARRRLAEADLVRMEALLERELEGGALGLSAGLLYTPGCFAPPEELARLLRTVARRDGIFATHLRSEGDRLIEALEETFDAARASGVRRVRISHFKTAGRANWDKLDAALACCARAERDGIAVAFDRYPYCESMTQLSVIAPGRFGECDDGTLMRLLAAPGMEAELAAELAASGRDWTAVRLASTGAAEFRCRAGMTFDRIAAACALPAAAVAARLMRLDATGTTAAFRGMSERNLERIFTDPRCCCGTDESARPVSEAFGRSHPRGFGAFPRGFRLLADAGVPEGEIVRRLSAAPAEWFGLTDRGRLEAGRAADLVLFDPARFVAAADFETPHRPAEGVFRVWIDGREAEDGRI